MHIAPAEDPRWVPSTTRELKTVTLVSRNSIPSSGYCGHCTHKHNPIHTHMVKITIKSSKPESIQLHLSNSLFQQCLEHGIQQITRFYFGHCAIVKFINCFAQSDLDSCNCIPSVKLHVLGFSVPSISANECLALFLCVISNDYAIVCWIFGPSSLIDHRRDKDTSFSEAVMTLFVNRETNAV